MRWKKKSNRTLCHSVTRPSKMKKNLNSLVNVSSKHFLKFRKKIYLFTLKTAFPVLYFKVTN